MEKIYTGFDILYDIPPLIPKGGNEYGYMYNINNAKIRKLQDLYYIKNGINKAVESYTEQRIFFEQKLNAFFGKEYEKVYCESYKFPGVQGTPTWRRMNNLIEELAPALIKKLEKAGNENE